DQGGAYMALWNQASQRWEFSDLATPTPKIVSGDDLGEHELRVVTIGVTVLGDSPLIWDGLALDPDHTRDGSPDSVTARFAFDSLNPAQNRAIPVVITVGTTIKTGLDLLNAVAPATPTPSTLRTKLLDPKSTDAERSFDALLAGGNDGLR